MNTARSALRLGALTVALSMLTGCTAASSTPTAPASAAGTPISIVTSTDVWGSIATAIGGDHVRVTSIVSDPSADPHSYEAGPQNELAISRAAVIVENGGGYDDFMNRMIEAGAAKGTVLDAVRISGYPTAGAAFNEHVWYDFPTVTKVAKKIESVLSAIDPADATAFATNAGVFTGKVADLQRGQARIRTTSAGVGVAITEPVPLYLLQGAGLVNLTPPAFSEAVESDSDAAPSVVAQNRALFTGKKVKALIYNSQTTGPQTEQALAAARANGIPVVPVSETLPSGTDYVGWMNTNLKAIAVAVSS